MTQVCVISIYVPDLKEAIEFYTGTLGFELNKQYGPCIASLVHGDLPLILEENDQTTVHQDEKSSRIVLALRTNDINKTIDFLKSKNVDFIIDEPTDCPPGKYISFKDPFGNVLEYLQFN